MHLLSVLLLFTATTGQAFALDSYADLVETLMPSVVNISTENEEIQPGDNIVIDANGFGEGNVDPTVQ